MELNRHVTYLARRGFNDYDTPYVWVSIAVSEQKMLCIAKNAYIQRQLARFIFDGLHVGNLEDKERKSVKRTEDVVDEDQ